MAGRKAEELNSMGKIDVGFAKMHFKETSDTDLFGKRKRVCGLLKCVGIFLVYFLLEIKFMNDSWFPSDEQDIMQGGKALARGFLLYRDYLSQHMPVSYYLSALFEIFGAYSVPLQRMAFYVFYSFMWTVIYIRYQLVVKKQILFCYPFCLAFVVTTYSMGTVILSEHLAGIGFLILFLEFLQFIQQKELKNGSCFMISIAVLLTFGTIFIAAFGVFAVALGVFACELYWAVIEEITVTGFLKKIWLKYWKLGVWVGMPWVLYFIYLNLTGTFGDFYFSAYVMNRTIYSKYLGGFGSSILSTVFGMLSNPAWIIQGVIPGEGYSVSILIQTIISILAIMYMIHIFEKYGVIAGCTCVLLLMALGIRGFYNFHGTQSVSILCFLAVCSLNDLLIRSKEIFKKRSSIYKTCIVCIILMVSSVYVGGIGRFAELTMDDGENENARMIALITEQDEVVWNCTLSAEIFMQADRVGLYNVGAVPWAWEAHGERVLKEFEELPPRVVFFDREAVIWGHSIADYAKDLIKFIDLHFTRYQDSSLYIRNDYYKKVEIILRQTD